MRAPHSDSIPLPALSLDGVSYRIGRREILREVSLQVEAGTIAGVLGPNGAGKSTLLSLVTGLRRASAGEISVLGMRLPVRGGSLRRRIGVVLQETALYTELSAVENLLFSASLYDVPNARQRVAEVLALLGLVEQADAPVHALSGGMRRRVTIARALLHDPEVLVIDEPTLGVDAEARHAIWAHLRLLRSQGRTILVATNYLDEAQALCDTVAVLQSGRVVAHESPEVLIARTGRVIDVDCSLEAREAVRAVLMPLPTVRRVAFTPSGVSIFLGGISEPDRILDAMRDITSISSFRIRAPDLVEVFRALEVTP